MNTPDTSRPAINRLYRLQWEEAQQAYVLLFPEGMIKLNGSAGEILRRCDGSRSLAQIVQELEECFNTPGLGKDVSRFLEHAAQRGWLQ